ncbi:MAG: VanW family protein, partial [Micrococcales bacterium]|nr:VanW family protein [Micrococcales bacterium]
MSSADARAALDAGLGAAATTPVPTIADGQKSTFVPAEAGLALDTKATVAQATGTRLTELGHLWRYVAGAGPVDPVSTVDTPMLEAAVDALEQPVFVEPVDATVAFGENGLQVTPAVDGKGLDAKATMQVLTEQWLAADGPLELPVVVKAPVITDAIAEQAVAEQATPLLAGPVTVVVSGSRATLSVAQLTAGAGFVPTDGALVLVLDGPVLVREVATQLPNVIDDASDARFDFDASGRPVIIDGVPGSSVAPEALSDGIIEASKTPARTTTVPLVRADPEHSRADLERLGVQQVVGQFSTPLTSEPRRTKNIANGASIINGTLVRPGETFSLGGTLSPIDATHGFVEAGVIQNGIHTDGMGGGLSQLSTTTFNAAFESGMELVEHKPHSEWFNRYPEGRESTLSYPGTDMKWKNNTPYGALVKAWVGPCDKSGYGCTFVQIWSTKHWTVESQTFERRNIVAPVTKH